jgi:osmoprotectant transport system permease protein
MMNWVEILAKTGEHLYLSFTALLIACFIAIPLGIYFANHDRLATPVIRVVQVIQTIPSLALLGFMVPIFGIGTLPAIIALILYSLLPVLQNTFTGILDVDKSLIEFGKGMGMTKRQILWLVQLPMSRSVILAGIRMAAVQTISIATIATFIGAGGLGDIIMRGIGTLDNATILIGAIPTALLAIFLDRFLLYIDEKLTPKGLRKNNLRRMKQ